VKTEQSREVGSLDDGQPCELVESDALERPGEPWPRSPESDAEPSRRSPHRRANVATEGADRDRHEPDRPDDLQHRAAEEEAQAERDPPDEPDDGFDPEIARGTTRSERYPLGDLVDGERAKRGQS
jgi:hypothetical protein